MRKSWTTSKLAIVSFWMGMFSLDIGLSSLTKNWEWGFGTSMTLGMIWIVCTLAQGTQHTPDYDKIRELEKEVFR